MSNLSWGTPGPSTSSTPSPAMLTFSKEYLSPERASGRWHDERQSDVWALGVTLYELLVGRTPFELTESEEFLTKDALKSYYLRTLKGQILGPRDVDRTFEDLIENVIRPKVEDRFARVEQVLSHPYFSQRRAPTAEPLHRRVAQLVGAGQAPAPSTPKKQQPSTPDARRRSPVKPGSPSTLTRTPTTPNKPVKVFSDKSPSPATSPAAATRRFVFGGGGARTPLTERSNALGTPVKLRPKRGEEDGRGRTGEKENVQVKPVPVGSGGKKADVFGPAASASKDEAKSSVETKPTKPKPAATTTAKPHRLRSASVL